MNRTVQRHGKISVVERWIKLSVLMFVETGCKCRIAASSIPSATVQSLNCQLRHPKKTPVILLLCSKQQKALPFRLHEKLLIPHSVSAKKVAVDAR